PGATRALVAMRTDLLSALRDLPELGRTDLDFRHLLRSWFNRGFLVLRQISWETPASILEKIVEYEAVHAIRDWDDLRRRLYPQDRRCFAYFHPTMPDEPLIFVEVALTMTVPGSIQHVLADDRDTRKPHDTKVAVFYSISNCQTGLKGISFGNLLIKQVVDELRQELPNLDTFVTLSPIPKFNLWLSEQDGDEAARQILQGRADADLIRDRAARYLATARNGRGAPFDPVARFHLGNGAQIYAVHSDADLSENGQHQSSGAMVNYHYDLDLLEQNHERFVQEGAVSMTDAFRATLADPKTKKQRKSA
ncbi:MAG: malonyl-CoA decarboxylase family protein, partial [Pseudomonadota bacterium]